MKNVYEEMKTCIRNETYKNPEVAWRRKMLEDRLNAATQTLVYPRVQNVDELKQVYETKSEKESMLTSVILQ